jgi:hypothetical protein
MESDATRDRIRVTVDEIEPDAENTILATLVTDNGEHLTIPLHLLPGGTRTGDVLTLAFEPDPDERSRRRQRIMDLQRRLFGSR